MRIAAILGLCLILAAPASGRVFRFVGEGVGAAVAEPTAHLAPGATFRFSFDLPAPLVDIAPGDGFVVNDIMRVRYTLDGRPVLDPLEQVYFYPESQGGGVDLLFAVGDLNLFGPDLGSDGVLRLGTYAIDFGTGGNAGQGSGSVTISQVPEPGSWLLMSAGLGGAGMVLRRRQLPVARTVRRRYRPRFADVGA